jgi:Carbon-nitrogen hydrolase
VVSNKLAVALFKNSVEIPGPESEALGAAARAANAYVVIGVCEKLPNTTGTMFNSQLYFSPDGVLIRKHGCATISRNAGPVDRTAGCVARRYRGHVSRFVTQPWLFLAKPASRAVVRRPAAAISASARHG